MQSLLKGEVLRGALRRPLKSDAGSVFDVDPARGNMIDLVSGQKATNGRGTERTVIRGGRVHTVGIGQVALSDRYGRMRTSIQPAATNLVPYSERFDLWAASAYADVAANAAVAPDGNPTADKLIATAQAGAFFTLMSPGVALADDEDHVVSIFAKPEEITWLRVQAQAKDSSLPNAYFDLANQVVGASTALAAGIEDIGGGYVRPWLRFNSQSGATAPLFRVQLAVGDGQGVFNGDGYSGLYLWGAQVEQGTVPTAHIPTVATPVSRAADAVYWDLLQAIRNILSTAESSAIARGTLVMRGWVTGYNASDVALYTYLNGVGCADSNYGLMYSYRTVDGQTYITRTSDGPNSSGYLADMVAGTSYDRAARWDSAAGLFQAGYKLSAASSWIWGPTATFDGAYSLGDYLHIGYQPEYPFEIGPIELHERWLEDPR